MLRQNNLPCQAAFGFLSVPELQPTALVPDAAMDHDAFSRSGSAKSQKSAVLDQDAYVPVNYISPEVYALLAAAEASAARRAEAQDAGGMDLDSIGQESTLQTTMGGWHDPANAMLGMAPPKRYYRIFWRSVSKRLLQQSAH